MFGRWERRRGVAATDRDAFRRRLGLAAASFLMVSGLMITNPTSAFAAVPYSDVPIDGWDTNGRVFVVKVHGTTVYLGGEFTTVRAPGNTPTQSRSNFAAIDLTTGDILPFVADTNAPVRAIETDGSTVWVGGSFNNINGVHRPNLAAVDATTGNVKSLDVSMNGAVHGLALSGGRLYAGGYFTVVEGVAQQRVASLDPVTGSPDPGFQANADTGVRDVAVSATGRLLVGGTFSTIGGKAWAYMAELDPTTGQGVGPGYDEMIAPMLDIDVSPDGTFVFAAVAGLQNRAAAWNTFDGERRWYHKVMGDTQAVSYWDGTLYFGFHEGFEGDETLRLLAADVVTGELQDFYPSINSFMGVWAIDANEHGLAIGGEFTVVSGVSTRGIAVFESDGTPPDTTPPTKPTNLRMLPGSGGSVQLAWDASSDNRAVSHYRVYRDGVLVGATAETTFADDSAGEGTTYSYQVRASDLAGNLSPMSSSLQVRTWISVIDAGSSWRYEDEPQFSSNWLSPGFDDSGWDSGPAELGFGDGDEATLLPTGRTTYYFRKSFSVPPGETVVAASLGLIRDDAAVIYLNGQEVMRDNLPAGAIDPDTRALTTISGAAEREWLGATIDPSLFATGNNVVQVEIHQRSPGSSDVSFDFRLDYDVAGAVADTDPPSRPQALTTETRTSTRIWLEWEPSNDDTGVAGYQILRDGVEVATTAGTSYLDRNLWPETEYSYRVVAFDAAGNLSPASSPSVSTTNSDGVKPRKPKNVTTSATPTSITIRWEEPWDNVGISHYVIKSFGKLLGTTTDLEFTATGLEPEFDYHISVRAVDLWGNRSKIVHRRQVTPPLLNSYLPIAAGHMWRYLDDGTDQGAAWRQPGYDDSAWATGTGEFGYGDGDEVTVVDEGPSNDRHITTYFRTTFEIIDKASVDELRLRLIRDDGIAVYVNGVEVLRDNLPTGALTSETLAVEGVSGADEDVWQVFSLPITALSEGNNVIAIELHQKHRNSSDVSLDVRLNVNP